MLPTFHSESNYVCIPYSDQHFDQRFVPTNLHGPNRGRDANRHLRLQVELSGLWWYEHFPSACPCWIWRKTEIGFKLRCGKLCVKSASARWPHAGRVGQDLGVVLLST